MKQRPWSKPPATSREFLLMDYPRTLFPLKTNRFLAEEGFDRLLNLAQPSMQEGNSVASVATAFLPQRKAAALKAGWHLRRTAKLDPVAEAFIYDFVFRNRRLIRGPMSSQRECYGYTFKDGFPQNPTLSYRGFKGAKSEYTKKYKHNISFDVASYFNSIYQHDLVAWARDRNFSPTDADALGRFLREINSGRSVDCLPQGIYPTKMIGNDFLKFIDSSVKFKSPQFIRFMDDMVLFGDKREDVISDFYMIQDLLGKKALSVNSSKTKLSGDDGDIVVALDAVKAGLLQKRRTVVSGGYDDDVSDQYDQTIRALTPAETDRLKEMLAEIHLEEEDAELILTMMGQHSSDVLERFDVLLSDFPNLSKNLYSFCRHIDDKETLAEIIQKYVKDNRFITEYQLFWIGMILDDHLIKTKNAGNIVAELLGHPQSTVLTKAKILEIPTSKFGLPELRIEQFGEGKSDWLAWSAAVGTRLDPPATRNYALAYYKNVSSINKVIAEIVTSYSNAID